jgi:hypothetical protein
MTRALSILALSIIVAAPAVYIIGRLAWHVLAVRLDMPAEVLP